MDESQEKVFEIRIRDDITPDQTERLENETRNKILGVIAVRVVDRDSEGKFLVVASPKHRSQLYTLLYTLGLDHKE